MGVQFVLGKASMDHDLVIKHQLSQWQQQDPTGRFFYLVPEHIKFESEVDVLNYLQGKNGTLIFASANVQVFSFTRFAWFFLRDSSVLNRQNLSKTGLAMMVTHLLNQIDREKLTIFKSEQNQAGFAAKLADQLMEFRLNGIEPDDLLRMQTQAAGQHQSNLADKLGDLAVIYQAFLNYRINDHLVLDQFLDPAKLMDLLLAELKRLDLSNYYFFLSGFDRFNAQEMQVIQYLMNHAQEVMISLPLDDLASKKMPRPNELFYKPAKLYQQLRQLTPAKNIKVRWALKQRVSSSLQKLETFWCDRFRIGMNQEVELTQDEKDDITITQTVDRIHEIKWVAGEIRRMVALSQSTDHPYQYSDFLILTPDPAKYQNLIGPLFEQYQVPLFTDLTQTMASHPLVEFILALFDVHQHGFNYQSIMRFLKTELFIPKQIIAGRTLELMKKREQEWLAKHPDSKNQIPEDATEIELKQAATYRNTLDVVENYLLAHGIQTKAGWQKEWIVRELPPKTGETADQLLAREQALTINRNANLLRQQVLALFDNFNEQMKGVKTGLDFAVVLYDLMQQAGVSETLQQWQQGAMAIQEEGHTVQDSTLHGNASDPTRPEQVWNVFCQLMDEYVLALGDEPFDSHHFVNVFQNGFETATYKRVPSTLDQVIFSQSGMLQMQNRKITFIIGATDDVMPARIENEQLLSEDDRHLLNEFAENEQQDQFLFDTSELRMAAEPFTNYLAMMSSSQKLLISYPLNDVDGTELSISPYIKAVKDKFNLPINKIDLVAPNYGPEIKQYIGTPTTVIDELLQVCRELQRTHKMLSSEWIAIYNYVKKIDPQRLVHVFASLNFHNEILPQTETDTDGHKKLDEQLVHDLYGNEIFGSISRLETYFKNPYEYFLKYGLALRPRTIFEPTSANVGDYFHDVVAELINEIQRNGETLATLKSNDFDGILSKVLVKIAALDEFDVFKQTARNRYLQKRLIQSTRKVSHALYRQHKKRKVFTLKTEATFGFGHDAVLDGKIFNADKALHSGIVPQMKLQGRLDRIDIVEDAKKHLYLNVADYKSGNINAKLQNFLVKSYSGISLQLLTYLAVLRDNQQKVLQLLKQDSAVQQQLTDANEAHLNLGSAVYFHLGTPQTNLTDFYKKGASPKQAISSSDAQFVYDGIFHKGVDAPEDYVKALGTVYDRAEPSLNLDNYKLALTKKGTLNKASLAKTYSQDQFDQLLNLDLYRISQATNDIFTGVIDLAPYRLNNMTGLDYSDYLPIMTFDQMIGNQYRDLGSLAKQSPDELWQEIEQTSLLWHEINQDKEDRNG